MTVRNLARISNHFEPSDQSLALDELISTREVAALFGCGITAVLDRVRRRGMRPALHRRGTYYYWTPAQVEQIRRPL